MNYLLTIIFMIAATSLGTCFQATEIIVRPSYFFAYGVIVQTIVLFLVGAIKIPTK